MDIFISHASEDTDVIARPLAKRLQQLGVRVWLDEHILTLGDSLPGKIDQGLAHCNFGVVVLSRSFFAKEWTRRELDALANLELIRKQKLMVPILHGIAIEEVANFSPALASRYAISTAKGIEQVVEAILAAIGWNDASDQDKPGQYEIIRVVAETHYSKVTKCRNRETGWLCIVKETEKDYVSQDTLEALKKVNARNLVKSENIWEQDGKICEELPYVGGIRLSQAIIPGFGGLTGSVLESLETQLRGTLSALHEAQIVHRDIHPDNIYLVVNYYDRNQLKFNNLEWEFDEFGGFAAKRFSLSWILVDCTFASLLTETSRIRYRHGAYTSEEQEAGATTAASDMYALGATLFYCISGHELPSFQRRRREPPLSLDHLGSYHPSREFNDYLERLLALDPMKRPTAQIRLGESTTAEGFTGILRLEENQFLACNTFQGDCQILTGQEMIQLLDGNETRLFSTLEKNWPLLKTFLRSHY